MPSIARYHAAEISGMLFYHACTRQELAKQGHVQLLFRGDGLKKQVTRFLGGWWIEAAIKGHPTQGLPQ